MSPRTGIVLLTAFLIVSATIVSAQAPDILWMKNYGFGGIDEAWQIKQTPDGGFIVVGFSQLNDDIYLLKTDENGDTLWTSLLGFTSNDVGRSVEPLDDGGYIITGYGGGYIVLMKTDSLGNHLWHRYLESGWGRALRVTENGDFIVAGWTPGTNSAEDIYVARTDIDGDTIWTRTFNADGFERPWDVRETPDGGFIILGWTQPIGGQSDMLVIRINANGDSLWSRTYGDIRNDEGRSIFVNDDGSFVLAGKISDSTNFADIAIISADSQGDTIWTRTFPCEGTEFANSITATPDGNYIITGMKTSLGYIQSSFIMKIGAYGDSLWSVAIEDSAANLYCRSIVQAEDGGYVVAGYRGIPYTNYDVFLAKLAPDITGIEANRTALPSRITLHQNYPNPFNAKTTISFKLNEPGDVLLSLYDLLGRKLSVLAADYFDAGTHDIIFDATDLTSGIYFYNLKTGEISETKTMILLK